MTLSVPVTEVSPHLLEVDVNEIVQLEIDTETQEVDVEIKHVPICRFTFSCILKTLTLILSSVFSIFSIVFGFITGRF
jgi:hypothetical protein